MSGFANQTGITPASLSFLTIYNPSLCVSDESAYDQILYYYEGFKEAKKDKKGKPVKSGDGNRDDINRKLREIGLAQATVQFAA